MSELRYWIALNYLPDIGPVFVRRLLSALGTPENIFEASGYELKNIEGIGENRARKILSFRDWDKVNEEIERAEKSRAEIIHLNDPRYPEALKRIQDAPLVLYCKGELAPSDKYSIAMVGSRNFSDYGVNVASKISNKLAKYGLTVISGMARGIDTVSHRGALDAGGRTIAVLGSGIDIPYPSSNRRLMEIIESNGAVITEFPLGTKPQKENFPKRNRIISALSLGVIVVEATLDSGSLITVAYALEQGKEVFAVPGNITSNTAKGTNDLIKKGARLIQNAEDVIEELGLQLKGLINEDKQSLPDMSDEEIVLYNYLDQEPKHIDSITRGINMTTSKTLSLLLNLELKGVVKQGEGKNFFLQ